MKRFCCLAVLIALTTSAYAGSSISFRVGGHRVHIESPRHCRSASCTSVSISRSLDWRRKHDRYDDDRDAGVPAKPAPSAPQTVSPPAPPATTAPAKTIVTAPPPAVYTPAASTTRIVAAPPTPPPAPPSAQQVSIPGPPPPPVAKPVETAQPAPQVERVSHQAEEGPPDSPIGDWQTEGKGTVRIAKCGNALCGYVLNSSSNEKGEAILINMKPKRERQWTGSIYSQDSGETYYGTMSMKGLNTLRVEACALGRFYCSGNNWSRITRRADSLVSSRPVSAEQRS
ncbi:DUF2147 domain-containing protein [Bradyrhizobium sp. CSA112]|uniref:DUF2147 domain-containing protein n=1 Tax=Bradyrhizobium sp. CSA112 TaxID=2699170 RepID=UPI0023AF9BBA|nr:DUF2147 domain-containing protein [Bradyrhizobium sp. CSA112]MDE5454995.1 DUF2147 domain-containing protein [Bradyrhizobium sp. CSA112]